jgi:hypothetical protein
MFPHVFAALLPKFISFPEVSLLTWICTERLMTESSVEPLTARALTQPMETTFFKQPEQAPNRVTFVERNFIIVAASQNAYIQPVLVGRMEPRYSPCQSGFLLETGA